MVGDIDTRLSLYALITGCQAGTVADGGRALDIGGSDHASSALHGGLYTKGNVRHIGIRYQRGGGSHQARIKFLIPAFNV